MRITIRLFGHLRDLAPDYIQQEVVAATTGSVADTLVTEHPALTGLTSQCRVAVNYDFTDWNRNLEDGDEVAFLPPMSGG